MHGTEKSNHLPFPGTIRCNHRFFLKAIESGGFFSVLGAHKFCRELFPSLSNYSHDGTILHQKFSSQFLICEEVIAGNISPTFFKKALRALALLLNRYLFPSAYLLLFLCTHPFFVRNVMLKSRIALILMPHFPGLDDIY